MKFCQNRDRANSRINLVQIIKKVLLLSRPLPIFSEELVKSNMQDITLMKCPTNQKKIREIGGAFGKMTFFPFCTYTSTRPSL